MLITKSKKRWISNIECVDKSQKDSNKQNKSLKEHTVHVVWFHLYEIL